MSLLSGADRALTYEILRARGEAASASRVMARYDAFGTLGLALAFPRALFSSRAASSNTRQPSVSSLSPPRRLWLSPGSLSSS